MGDGLKCLKRTAGRDSSLPSMCRRNPVTQGNTGVMGNPPPRDYYVGWKIVRTGAGGPALNLPRQAVSFRLHVAGPPMERSRKPPSIPRGENAKAILNRA